MVKESSLIKGFQYIPSERILFVRFHNNGSLYSYFDIPKTLIEDMEDAESIGHFFLSKIRNQFNFQKINI